MPSNNTPDLLHPVHVKYALTGEGYHKELLATLWRDAEDEKTTTEASYFVMIVNVTSSIYIDIDQVSLWAVNMCPD